MLALIRTSLMMLRRDRPALALSFLIPVAFFSIFAVIFGGRKDVTPRVNVIVVDEDHSSASQSLMRGLQQESSLRVTTFADPAHKGAAPVEYTAATAEEMVRAGKIPVALVIPHGFGANPISFGSEDSAVKIRMLSDSSDPVAPQVVAGMLQKSLFTSLGPALAQRGTEYLEMYAGGLTEEQHRRIQKNLDDYAKAAADRGNTSASTGTKKSDDGGMMLGLDKDTVVGATQDKPILAFYAAAVGVMFLLFTSTGAAGSLLEEAESGTLDRVLSSRITMTRLLAGKLSYNMLLAFAQLTVMFVWAWTVFHVDLPRHLLGFLVMGLTTSFAVAAFGILLASFCHTRAQLGSISTLAVLMMSSIGGSMFPRYLMPLAMQKAGLFTINAWAIDGFQKVFWYELPVWQLWPQAVVLTTLGTVLFLVSRRLARRWETA